MGYSDETERQKRLAYINELEQRKYTAEPRVANQRPAEIYVTTPYSNTRAANQRPVEGFGGSAQYMSQQEQQQRAWHEGQKAVFAAQTVAPKAIGKCGSKKKSKKKPTKKSSKKKTVTYWGI